MRVALLLAFSVKGKLAPENENPVPLNVAELIVTAVDPVDDKVSVSEAVVFTCTLPKFKLVALTLNVGVAKAIPGMLRIVATASRRKVRHCR